MPKTYTDYNIGTLDTVKRKTMLLATGKYYNSVLLQLKKKTKYLQYWLNFENLTSNTGK